MLSVFSSPSRYTQGPNATASLGPEMQSLGLPGPVLIVAGRSARRLLSAVWQTTLGDAGYRGYLLYNLMRVYARADSMDTRARAYNQAMRVSRSLLGV